MLDVSSPRENGGFLLAKKVKIGTINRKTTKGKKL